MFSLADVLFSSSRAQEVKGLKLVRVLSMAVKHAACSGRSDDLAVLLKPVINSPPIPGIHPPTVQSVEIEVTSDVREELFAFARMGMLW